MVGVMMVDLSAAFDMVDHDILMKKLEQFGLDSKAIAWMAEARVSRIVAQYHVQSHIVMGVGEQDVMWMTVLSAWLEQILWPYLVDLQSSVRLVINTDKTHLLVLGKKASADRRTMVSM